MSNLEAQQKIQKIIAKLAGVHPYGMTEIELKIRDIIEEKQATSEEKEWAKRNTETLEFSEQE